MIAVQIFDQRKFKKRDQGFLGVVNVKVADVIDLELGGHGASLSPLGWVCPQFCAPSLPPWASVHNIRYPTSGYDDAYHRPQAAILQHRWRIGMG